MLSISCHDMRKKKSDVKNGQSFDGFMSYFLFCHIPEYNEGTMKNFSISLVRIYACIQFFF